MAVRSKEELVTRLKSIGGDQTSDAYIELLEDLSDTADDYERRISESGDWQRKYEDNDREWRERYTSRFYGNSQAGQATETSVEGDNPDADYETQGGPTTYEELFS